MIQTVLKEIEGVLARTEEPDVAPLLAAPRVFVAGEGRSGFMAKAFAMRLMHLGLDVHVIGETVTPALAPDDLLVVVSGSGTLRHAPRANTLAVTADPDSPLARSATTVWHVPAATKHAHEGTVQPLSSLFDQCTHIVLDAACLEIARAREVSHAAALAAHV